MKLIMVLLVLISRELLSPEWRALLAKPSYWWRDTWLTIAEKQRLAAPVVSGQSRYVLIAFLVQKAIKKLN